MCFRPPTIEAGPVKCPKCGAEVDPTADTCPNCGAEATPAPGMPGVPGAPGAPKAPGAPGVPGAPKAPGAPSAPKAPGQEEQHYRNRVGPRKKLLSCGVRLVCAFGKSLFGVRPSDSHAR